MFFEFLKIQYFFGNIDNEKLLSFVPIRITKEQADEIIKLKEQQNEQIDRN